MRKTESTRRAEALQETWEMLQQYEDEILTFRKNFAPKTTAYNQTTGKLVAVTELKARLARRMAG